MDLGGLSKVYFLTLFLAPSLWHRRGSEISIPKNTTYEPIINVLRGVLYETLYSPIPNYYLIHYKKIFNFKNKISWRKLAKMVDTLFVKSKVREYINNKDCNTGGEVVDGDVLNDRIVDILDKAIARAKANGRKTVQEKDL